VKPQKTRAFGTFGVTGSLYCFSDFGWREMEHVGFEPSVCRFEPSMSILNPAKIKNQKVRKVKFWYKNVLFDTTDLQRE